MEESALPLQLPAVSSYLPTEDGQPPLGRAENWTTPEGYPIELCTMPASRDHRHIISVIWILATTMHW